MPAMQETQVLSLGWEDPLEKGMSTHSNILAWRILWTEEPGGQSMRSQTVGHDWGTKTIHQVPQQSQQFSSVTQSGLTVCDPRDCSKPGFPFHYQLPEFTQTHVHRVGDVIQTSHPLSSPSPSAFNPSSIRGFSSESVLYIRWPKYWSFSFSISPSNEYSGLISFRMDWLDLLAVQGTLKSLLQYHGSKASILWHSAFFTVQLSHPYITTGKTIALSRWTFVGKAITRLNLSPLWKVFHWVWIWKQILNSDP